MWVCVAIERYLRSSVEMLPVSSDSWSLRALYAYVCVSVYACVRRAHAHIGQQTRGRLSSGSGSSVRTLHLCDWMLALSPPWDINCLYVCSLPSFLEAFLSAMPLMNVLQMESSVTHVWHAACVNGDFNLLLTLLRSSA